MDAVSKMENHAMLYLKLECHLTTLSAQVGPWCCWEAFGDTSSTMTDPGHWWCHYALFSINTIKENSERKLLNHGNKSQLQCLQINHTTLHNQDIKFFEWGTEEIHTSNWVGRQAQGWYKESLSSRAKRKPLWLAWITLRNWSHQWNWLLDSQGTKFNILTRLRESH